MENELGFGFIFMKKKERVRRGVGTLFSFDQPNLELILSFCIDSEHDFIKCNIESIIYV